MVLSSYHTLMCNGSSPYHSECLVDGQIGYEYHTKRHVETRFINHVKLSKSLFLETDRLPVYADT